VKTGIKRALTGRTMRVATAFTGAAAAAAAFTPAAHAATAIEDRSCSAGTTHWLQLGDNSRFFASGQFHYGHISTCLGYTGTAHPNFPATSFCGGNNYGYISGYQSNDAEHYYNHYKTAFHPGTFFAKIPGTSVSSPLVVSKVYISKWAGNDTCP
jgi:hypothetical protein